VLTTTGRKSGQARDSVLVYADDGTSRVVVASNGGAGRAPAGRPDVPGEPSLPLPGGGGRHHPGARGGPPL